jgi:hypothetical protein
MTKHTRFNLILVVIVAGLIAVMLLVASGGISSAILAQSVTPTVSGKAGQAIGLETFRDIAKAQTPMVRSPEGASVCRSRR